MPRAATAALMAFALALLSAAPAHAASTPAPTPLDGAKPAACPDYEFIGARGSGEDNGVPSKTRYTAANPTLGMGGPVSDLFKRVSATASANATTVVPYGVPYPAVGIDVVGGDALLGGDLDVYSKSVELGAHAAAAELDRVSRACPETGVIMSGYSQGAQAVVDAVLSATPSARKSLVATVLFGNTYFSSADAADDYGNFAPGLDGYLVRSGTGPASASSESPDWGERFGGVPIFDYCHDGDPICGLVEERRVDGTSYPVRDFAHIVASTGDDSGSPNILTHHTTYQRGDTANAAQQLRFALGLPLDKAPKASAQITAPPTTVVGVQTRFNAGGSLSDPADPIVAYRWTIDAGTAAAREFTTSTPLTSATFLTSGVHTVGLRTTTASGGQATASARITAAAAPTSAPSAPGKMTTTAGDGAAALSWPAVKDAEFYVVTDAGGKLLTAFTPLVSGQQTVSWTDTGLSNGRARGYRVYAVNSMGRGAASKTVTVTPRAAAQHPAATTVRLPVPATTLMEPELVWSLGLGLIVLVLVIALVAGGRADRGPAAGRASAAGTGTGQAGGTADAATAESAPSRRARLRRLRR